MNEQPQIASMDQITPMRIKRIKKIKRMKKYFFKNGSKMIKPVSQKRPIVRFVGKTFD